MCMQARPIAFAHSFRKLGHACELNLSLVEHFNRITPSLPFVWIHALLEANHIL